MGARTNGEQPTPAELKEKFGEEADTYAKIRAEAAEASGRRTSSKKWEEIASDLRIEESMDGDDE